MNFYDIDDVMHENENKIISNDAYFKSGDDFFPTPIPTHPRLLPGEYAVNLDRQRGIFFTAMDVTTEEHVNIGDDDEAIIADINKFWGMKEEFKLFNLIWKRGVLLYGPPGSGKTTILNMVVQHLISIGGIVVHASDVSLLPEALNIIRRTEPDRPIAVTLEDIDMILNTDEGNKYITPLLDGQTQIDNVVYLATTNTVDALHSRLVKRPSRFDVVRLVGMPSATAKQLYMETLLSRRGILEGNEHIVEKLIAVSDGYSIPHIKEFIISHFVFKKDFDETVERLNAMVLAGNGGNDDTDDDDSTVTTEPNKRTSRSIKELIDSCES